MHNNNNHVLSGHFHVIWMFSNHCDCLCCSFNFKFM